MGATPTYGFPYPELSDPADANAAISALALAVENLLKGVTIGSYGTTLPASPVSGQIAVLVDSTTNPTYQWMFRYNASSSSAYKWECIGGSRVLSEVLAQEAIVNSGFGGLTTPGPQIVVPRAGEYEMNYGASTNMAGSQYGILTLKLCGNAIAASEHVYMYPPASPAEISVSRTIKRTLLASDTVLMQYSSSSGTITANFRNRFLALRPVRVS